MAEASAPHGAIRSGVLEDSNLDPFDLMSRGQFRRFVKHYAPDLLVPGMRRDDVVLGDGRTEVVGAKSALKQRGFTGGEPIPNGIRASVPSNPVAAEEFREARAQATVKLGDELKDKVATLNMPKLRKLGKQMGVRQTPKTKKAALQQMILDAANEEPEDGQDAPERSQ